MVLVTITLITIRIAILTEQQQPLIRVSLARQVDPEEGQSLDFFEFAVMVRASSDFLLSS